MAKSSPAYEDQSHVESVDCDVPDSRQLIVPVLII